MKFNKNLSAIHGYLCADGYVIKNPESQKHKYYHIGLRNNELILLNDFQKRFEEEFKIKPIICKDGRCKVQNKELYYFLTKKYSYYSKDWVLPRLSKNNLKYWLRSYFDCEAWVALEHRKNRHIGGDCINFSGLNQVKENLKRFGIISKIKKVKKRNIFRLFIYGKENLIKFQKEINFLHPKKKKKLEMALDSYVDYNWIFPKGKRDLMKFISDKARIGKNRIRFNSIIKENLEKISEILSGFKIESKVYGPWMNGLGNKYFQLVIQKKDQIEKFKQKVYI